MGVVAAEKGGGASAASAEAAFVLDVNLPLVLHLVDDPAIAAAAEVDGTSSCVDSVVLLLRAKSLAICGLC